VQQVGNVNAKPCTDLPGSIRTIANTLYFSQTKQLLIIASLASGVLLFFYIHSGFSQDNLFSPDKQRSGNRPRKPVTGKQGSIHAKDQRPDHSAGQRIFSLFWPDRLFRNMMIS